MGLADIRKANKMSQTKLARITGLTAQTISNIETGRITRPDLQTLLLISQALNACIYDILDVKKPCIFQEHEK